MTPDKAIEILEGMKTSLPAADKHTCGPWQSQISSYAIVFFGRDSPQYNFICKFQIYNYGIGDLSFQLENAKPTLEAYINDCIAYIKNCGLKKREWKHIFLTTHPALFWTIFSAILIFAFWLGSQLAVTKSTPSPSTINRSRADSIRNR